MASNTEDVEDRSDRNERILKSKCFHCKKKVVEILSTSNAMKVFNQDA